MDAIGANLIGALNGIATSALFLIILFTVRPRIVMSPQLTASVGPDGRDRFAVKVRNLARFSLLEVQAKASIAYGAPGISPRVGRGTQLELEYPSLFDLGRRERKKSIRGSSTFVFYFSGDLPPLDEPDLEWVIRMGVSSRHVLSQFGGVAKRNYVGTASVVRGVFAPGASLEIIPLDGC